MMHAALRRLVLYPAIALWALPALAIDYRVDQSSSVFAVVTQKTGPGAAFGHNHLITAAQYQATLRVDTAAGKSEFDFQAPAQALTVNDRAAEQRVMPALRKAGIVSSAFPSLSESQMKGLRKNMFGPSLLDVDQFKTIRARAFIDSGSLGQGETDTHLDMDFTVHGRTASRRIPAHIRIDQGLLHAEALAAFKFTDFGIQPYSAFAGLIRNDDTFHVYVMLTARERKVTAGAK